jgi:hypothetical protein
VGSDGAFAALEGSVACAVLAGRFALTATCSAAILFPERPAASAAGVEALRETELTDPDEDNDPDDVDEAAASARTAASLWSAPGDEVDVACAAYAAKSRIAAFLVGGVGRGMVCEVRVGFGAQRTAVRPA